METSVNPTPASMGGTALTWWGGSTAPAPPPTTDQSVNGKEKHMWTLGHLQRRKSSHQVGARLKLVLRSGDTGKFLVSIMTDLWGLYTRTCIYQKRWKVKKHIY